MTQIESNANYNREDFMSKSQQYIELNTPVSRRKLGMILEMDDRLLKEYEDNSIITGIKVPGLKNTRFVPRLVLEQIAESVRTEHTNKQLLFKTAKQYLIENQKKGIYRGKEKQKTV